MNQLSSDRLSYEKLSERHFSDYYSTESDPVVMEFLKRPTDEKSVRERFEKNLKYAVNNPGFGFYAVFTKDTQEYVGIGVLVHIERKVELGKVEVGYSLRPQFWGQGYALEIATTLINFAFETLKLKELWGTTDPAHIKSQNVLIKAGMQKVGLMPYHGSSMVFVLKNPKVY